MLRLFVAVKPPEDVCEHLTTLRGGLPNARWTLKENHHITLRFIGEVDENVADFVDGNLRQVYSPAFDLSLCTIGYFTKGKNDPRNLWTGVSNYHSLDHLHDKVESAVTRAGAEPNGTRFHAHCTIAKLSGTPPEEVQLYIARNNLFRSRDFKVDRFYLLASRLSQKGSMYQELGEYPLR